MTTIQFPERPDESSRLKRMLTLLCGIPINFIYLLVLAFGSGAAPSKRNFARASSPGDHRSRATIILVLFERRSSPRTSTAVTDVSSHVFQRGDVESLGCRPPFSQPGALSFLHAPSTTPWEIGHIPWCDLRLSAGRSSTLGLDMW